MKGDTGCSRHVDLAKFAKLASFANLATLVKLAIVWGADAEFELAFADLQGLDLVFERGSRDVEAGSGSCRPRDPAAGLGQCGFDDLPFTPRVTVNGSRWSCPSGWLRRLRGQPEFVDSENTARAQNHRSLDHILQLTDVAWPIVRLQQVQRLLVDRMDLFARPAGVALHEVLDQHQEILFPCPERGHFKGKDIEAVIEILTEAPSGDRGRQVAIRGGNDADVHVDRV